MNRIGWVVLGWLTLSPMVQADGLECTQPLGKAKMFMLCGKSKTLVQAGIPLEDITSILKTYPDSRSILGGDLDHDGINDFVVDATEQTSAGLVDRVIILKGKSGGGYVNFAKSSTIEHGAIATIKHDSLMISLNKVSNHKINVEIYQFKNRDGVFYLTTKTDGSFNYVEGNSEKLTGLEIDSNYLTGEVIETSRTDGRITGTTKKRIERKLTRLEDFTR
jgi:hypothetical protein